WTEVPGKPLDDGTQLIIRYAPRRDEDVTGGDHELTYDQLSHRFRWGEKERRWDEWKRAGLCRIAVRDGKFHSLFPKLENPLPPDWCLIRVEAPTPSP